MEAMQSSVHQYEALDQLGYWVGPGVLDGAIVGKLCQAFAAAKMPDTSGTQHVEITPKTPEYSAWAQLPTHPLIVAAAEYILKRPCRLSAVHGRNPLPGFGQQGLHVDWQYRKKGEPYAIVTSIFM